MKFVRSLLIVTLVGVGLLGPVPSNASASESQGYDVVCVTRTVPVDPEPFRVCVYYPL